MTRDKPPGRQPDDERYPDDVEIVAMTIRHGSDYVKQYLNSLALAEPCDEDSERLASFAADLSEQPSAEVLPFAAREPKA